MELHALVESKLRRHALDRRMLLGGLGASALLALPGCAGYGRYSLVDAVRRMLELSADRAFARLLAPGGFWDNALVRLDLPEVFGRRGSVLQTILGSAMVRNRLWRALNDVAEEGARAAAPAVTDAVRTIGIRNAVALIRGDPSAATTYLRGEMGVRLVDLMVPEIGRGLRIAGDPVVGQALAALTGVDVGGITNDLANKADDAIWSEIGRQEAAIRADPQATRDPLIISVFGPAKAL